VKRDEPNHFAWQSSQLSGSCPAFIGCYNEDLGTVCYANAGHTAGLLRDNAGITPLEANGLPLGLFPHTMQSAASSQLEPGSALLVVSRGIVEADNVDADHQACGIRTGRGEAKLSECDFAQRERTVHDRFAAGSEVHTDDFHTQRFHDVGAGADRIRRS
jgi:Stage II sporulation protein E (SpoIIE)